MKKFNKKQCNLIVMILTYKHSLKKFEAEKFQLSCFSRKLDKRVVWPHKAGQSRSTNFKTLA